MSYFTNHIDNQIVRLLQNGKVGLLPSDTIYGLSAAALNEQAVERVHQLKGRSEDKPFIVLISDINQLKELGVKAGQASIVKDYWPGALSIIFESASIPDWLQRGTNSLAIRMPDNQDLRDTVAKTGPIISTSANLKGQKPAASAQEAQKYFGEQLDFYVDVGKFEGQASTLIKIESGQLKVMRQGALKIKN